MTPGLVLLVIVACLVAMLPVWRLRLAGWPARSLLAAWLVYTIGILLAVRFAGAFRFLLPILVLAYVAPFVAGPERLARVLRGRPREGPAVIDVTPKPAPGLPGPQPKPPAPDDDAPDDARRRCPRRTTLTGSIALHGGGEYVAGDEPAMDALVAAGAKARAVSADAGPVRVVLVPTAAARHRPDLAAANGRRAFEAAGERAGTGIHVEVASVLDGLAAADPAIVARLAAAHVIHLPGGDPDLLPAVLRGTPAWAAILRAHAAGACVAGASAGAMALAERLWTRGGPVEGLRLVPGVVVLPHFDPGRAAAWRRIVDPDERLTWLGLDERTLVIGRPGETWTVAGSGRANVIDPGSASASRSAGAGEVFAALLIRVAALPMAGPVG